MAAERQLVLDANILIRAVLGRRVRQIITDHAERASFFAPVVAYEDALAYVPTLSSALAGFACVMSREMLDTASSCPSASRMGELVTETITG